MPQFRQDFITKEWVIVAPERAKRPDQFAKNATIRTGQPEYDPKCPFCPGNEDKTPPPSMTMESSGKWQLRVVPNKFAAVNPDFSPERRQDGKFLSANGFGIAEVIIENPIHNKCLALLSKDEVKDVITAYKARFTALALNSNVDLITIFGNHGEKAGTSLVHPHSQVIATPIVPPYIRQLMQQALIYHDAYGTCPYCVMLEEEVSQGKRVVHEGTHFVVICPYASKTPFEVRIVPRRHYSRFDGIHDDELDELSGILRITLKKLYIGLGDPDFNFVIRTSPTSDGELHYDHWRLIITPRITTPAGFEIGSGIFINTMPPEDSAEFLRGLKVE